MHMIPPFAEPTGQVKSKEMRPSGGRRQVDCCLSCRNAKQQVPSSIHLFFRQLVHFSYQHEQSNALKHPSVTIELRLQRSLLRFHGQIASPRGPGYQSKWSVTLVDLRIKARQRPELAPRANYDTSRPGVLRIVTIANSNFKCLYTVALVANAGKIEGQEAWSEFVFAPQLWGYTSFQRQITYQRSMGQG